MMKLYSVLVSAFFAASAVASAINVGDKAPPLDIKTWVMGKPVNPAVSDGETVYVLEFWATWCGPCRRSIPHLNELQERFRDKKVVIVGITYEPYDTVLAFTRNNPMAYGVAVDSEASTADTYMAGISGIPHALVIDKKGVVAWIGHPMDGLDAAIEKALQPAS